MGAPLLTLVGFGPGNGLGIARAFGATGFRLALVSRNPAKQSEALRNLGSAGIVAKAFAADSGNEASLAAAFTEIGHSMGGTEVLVYNAIAPGIARPTTLTAAGLIGDLNVGVVGALTATMAVLPAMKARKRGTILFTGGGWALYPDVEAASGSLVKAALRNFTFTLAEELRDSGVRIGSLTIMGAVAEGTPFAPARIGRAFLEYYQRPDAEFQPEVQFEGTT